MCSVEGMVAAETHAQTCMCLMGVLCSNAHFVLIRWCHERVEHLSSSEML
jgi:hypothetical protein